MSSLCWALRGKDELGAYAAAFRPINPLLLLPWLLMVPMIPVLTAAVARDRGAFVNQVRSACGIALGVGACGMIAGVMLAPDLVTLLYSRPLSRGRALLRECLPLAVRCAGAGLRHHRVDGIILADGKEKLLLTIGTIALIANVVLNAVLLRHYNFTAAGFATAVTELLFLVGALIAFQVVTGRSAFTGVRYRICSPAC